LYDINNVQVRFNQLTQEEHQELVDAQKAVKDARSAYDEYANARARIYELTSKQKLGKTSIKEDQELENLQSSLGQLAGKWVDAKTKAEGYSDIASKELEDLNQHIEQQNKLLDDSFNGFEQKTNDALGQRQLEAATKAAKDYLKSVNDWGDAVIASIKAGDSGSFEKEETAARNLSLAISKLSTNLTELTQYEEQYGDVVTAAIADGKVLTEAYNEQAEAVKLDIAVKHQKKEDAETQKQLTAAVRDYCKELENYLKLERQIADKRSSSDAGGADTIKLNEQLADSYDYLGQKLKDIGDIGGESALLAVSQITAKRVDENNRLIQTIEDANARKLRQKEIDDQQKSTYKQLVDETNRYYTALAKLEQLRTKRNITPDSSELTYWGNERDAADAARKSIRSANQKATGSEYLTDEYEADIQKIEEKGTRTVDRLHEKAEAFFRSMGEDLGDTVRTWQQAQDAIMAHLNNEYASFDIAKAFDGNKLVANVKQIDGSINSVTYTWDKMNQTIRQTEGPVAGANASFSKLGTALSGFVNQIGRMVAGYMSINALFNAIKSGVGYVRDLDKALAELQLVTQASDDTITQFAASASEVAQQLAMTTEEVIRSQTEWARLGYDAKDALDLATAASKLATAGFMTTEESTSQLPSAIQAFFADDISKGIITAGDAAMEISDKMVYVGKFKIAQIA